MSEKVGKSDSDRNAEEATLHVSNLTRNVKPGHLEEIFGFYGQVKNSEVEKDVRSGLSKGTGFVTFTNNKEAEQAVLYLDGGQLDGQVMKVSFVLIPQAKRKRETEDYRRRSPSPRTVPDQRRPFSRDHDKPDINTRGRDGGAGGNRDRYAPVADIRRDDSRDRNSRYGGPPPAGSARDNRNIRDRSRDRDSRITAPGNRRRSPSPRRRSPPAVDRRDRQDSRDRNRRVAATTTGRRGVGQRRSPSPDTMHGRRRPAADDSDIERETRNRRRRSRSSSRSRSVSTSSRSSRSSDSSSSTSSSRSSASSRSKSGSDSSGSRSDSDNDDASSKSSGAASHSSRSSSKSRSVSSSKSSQSAAVSVQSKSPIIESEEQ